jgi:acyl-CoA dehydrogenase
VTADLGSRRVLAHPEGDAVKPIISTPAPRGKIVPPLPSELASIAKRIASLVAAPFADEVDRDARFPSEAIEALRAERMLSVLVPVELGGAGATISQVAAVVEELGRHCASTAMVYAMHQIQVASIVRHSRSEWMDEYLTQIADQELLLASATTETGIGGDVRSSSCAIERDGERFRLEKDAPVISYGASADAVLVTARRTPDSPPNDQVLVVVPITPSTLVERSSWDTLGFRGTCSNGFLLHAEGHLDQILADPYGEISSSTMLPTSHLVWASVWLGIAGSAVDNARCHVRNEARRKPGTTPPAAVRLAELMGRYEEFRALVRARASEYELAMQQEDALDGMGFAIRMNALKTSASALVVEIVGQAMLICGMAGYRNDSELSLTRELRDAYGAALMVNNDRILGASAQMLLIHRGE